MRRFYTKYHTLQSMVGITLTSVKKIHLYLHENWAIFFQVYSHASVIGRGDIIDNQI